MTGSWRGLTTQHLREALEGTHRAKLSWVKESPTADQKTPVLVDDSVSITITFTGGTAAVVDCGGALDVPVAVDIATTATGISDHGIGTLSFRTATRPLRAALDFEGTRVSVTGILVEGAATAPEGTLEPKAEGAPGGSANFRE